MVEKGFVNLGLHKVTLRIAQGNRGSERVAEKLGFTREGVLREELRINGVWIDHTLYSLLEHELARRPAAT
jgi:ribosomal-protein-alanine N-acetyltransferase